MHCVERKKKGVCVDVFASVLPLPYPCQFSLHQLAEPPPGPGIPNRDEASLRAVPPFRRRPNDMLACKNMQE